MLIIDEHFEVVFGDKRAKQLLKYDTNIFKLRVVKNKRSIGI